MRERKWSQELNYAIQGAAADELEMQVHDEVHTLRHDELVTMLVAHDIHRLVRYLEPEYSCQSSAGVIEDLQTEVRQLRFVLAVLFCDMPDANRAAKLIERARELL